MMSMKCQKNATGFDDVDKKDIFVHAQNVTDDDEIFTALLSPNCHRFDG